jgi:hypothetical protein
LLADIFSGIEFLMREKYLVNKYIIYYNIPIKSGKQTDYLLLVEAMLFVKEG